MSKTLAGGYATHIQGSETTLAYALKITRRDGQVFGLTSHDRDATISAVTYDAGQGLDVTSIVTTAGLGVDNLELTTLHDETLFTTPAVLGGLWQGAEFLVFRYNWADTAAGTEPLIAGVFGNVIIKAGCVVAELRGLQQYLQQNVGSVSSKTCRARLGDARCTISLASWTHAGTVTTATSRQVFVDSALAQASDYFTDGQITWLTGNNAGLKSKVKIHANSGGANFTLALPLPSDVQVGDTFTAIAGCRKRLTEDCKTKFNNVLNFQGEPHRPGLDAVVAAPLPEL